MGLLITEGQVHDSKLLIPLLESFELEGSSVLANRGYDSDAIIEYITAAGAEAVIPSKRNRLEQRPYDEHLYNERCLVEMFFCKIKVFRRVATRYDKLACTFLGFVTLASIMVWLA